MKRLVYALMILLVLALPSVPSNAQETSQPSATSENEQLKKLKEENEILAEKLKKAENQKKLVDTYFPGTEQKLKEGTITLENNPYIETEILAYQMMSESARGFSAQLLGKLPDPKNNKKLFIYDEEQFASPLFYRAYLSQLDLLEQRYLSLPNMTPTPTPASSQPTSAGPGFAPALLLPIIQGVLGSAADIASLITIM